MKKLLLLFILSLSLTANSQNIPLGAIEYVEDMKVVGGDIFVAGYTFKVDKPDGYSTKSLLNRYDKNLKLVWSLVINTTNKSEINKIEIIGNKIYALTTHGKNTNKTSETFLMLYIISLEGKILDQTNFGRSFTKPSNIIQQGAKLHFSYSQPEGISYSDLGAVRPVLVEYDTTTKTFEKTICALSVCYPEINVSHNSEVYSVGRYNGNAGSLGFEQVILKSKNGEPKGKILHTNKSENILNAYSTKNDIVILSIFSGVYGDTIQYLKFTYYNSLTNTSKEKIILLSDYKWANVSFTTYGDKETTWLKVDDVNSKQFYAQITSDGTIISKLSLDEMKYCSNFIIKDNHQIQEIDGDLKITRKKIISSKK